MRIAVPRESEPGEHRVALVPESVKKLTAAGLTIAFQRGAGERAYFTDSQYVDAGGLITDNPEQLYAGADLVLRLGVPPQGEISLMREGVMLLSSLKPTRNVETVRALAARKITAFSTDAIPRTTRAQSMDTLSAMASIAGYKGALLAACELNRYAPMLMTAAGTIVASRFFVIGAGVAGLQAIATARRLGANVLATDVRPEVKEQIESVGAKYVGVNLSNDARAGGGYAKELGDLDKARQRDLLAEQCAQANAVITTALIGGVHAPRLIDADMVRKMKPGAVIIDLAADGGGNCELSQPGATINVNGVRIFAPLNFAATMSTDASTLWSRAVTNFVLAFWKDKAFNLDLSDDILKATAVTHNGEVLHPKVREAILTDSR